MLFAKYVELHPESNREELIMLHGALLRNVKAEIIQQIKTAPRFVALLTYDLGSTGHNCQMTYRIVFIERNWNPQV